MCYQLCVQEHIHKHRWLMWQLQQQQQQQ
jgi:hypothetical protein